MFAAALVTFTLATADARTTQIGRGPELNPVMRPIASRPVALYGVKLGGAAVTTWTVAKLRHDGRKKTAWVVWLSVNVAQSAVVIHNWRVR